LLILNVTKAVKMKRRVGLKFIDGEERDRKSGGTHN
jgi:hypothetical protein